MVRRRAAPHRRHREGPARISASDPAGRPDRGEGIAGALRDVPARASIARAAHPARGDPAHARRGRRPLVPGAPADHPGLAARGGAGRRRAAHLYAGAPRAADHDYIQHTVFSRNWGDRLRELLTAEDWAERTRLCDEVSPTNVLRSLDYYCLYPITVFSTRAPA